MENANSSHHVLVVDDNDTFREALRISLTEAGYQVGVASNGADAKDILGLEDYKVVISDVRMAPVNGLELLEYVKVRNRIPMILMTGFSDIVETQQAVELGAMGFLPKPFRTDELLALVDQAINQISGLPSPDEDYCKLSIEDFISGSQIKFDIFVRLSEQRYLKIAHTGENLPPDRVRHYREKGIAYLYLRKPDFLKYLGFNLALSKGLPGNTKVPRDKKMALLKHTGEVLLEHIHRNDVDAEAFEYAKSSVESCVAVLSEDSSTFELLTVLNTHTDHLYAHSLGVGAYSVMIARELGWVNPHLLFRIAMGGLLHDIGKKEIPARILAKKRIELTVAERALIETHSTRGVEILSTIRLIPTDVLQIVHHHHESPSGNGYPLRLKKEKIHPLARLIALADLFCKFVIRGSEEYGMTPDEAIQHIKISQMHEFDAAYVNALARLVVSSRGSNSKRAV